MSDLQIWKRNYFLLEYLYNKANGGNANVKRLLSKVFFQDFGLTQ